MWKNKVMAHWRVGLVLAVLGLAVFVRFWKIEYTPFPDDGDEMAQIMAGQSLWEYGRPIAWSSFEYKSMRWQHIAWQTEQYRKTGSIEFDLINPWFDHSFVLSSLVGGWSELLGYHFGQFPPALYYRLPMVVLAAVTLGLLFLVSQKLFGFWSGLASLTLAGFSPIFIFAQRMVIPENVLAPLLLLSVYLLLEKRSLKIIGLVAILAMLVKPTGLIVAAVVAISLFFNKKYGQAVAFMAVTVGVAGAMWVAYGSAINQPMFWAALKLQSFRLLGWSNPVFVFMTPGFHTKPILDFSYYLALLLGLGIFLGPDTKQLKILKSAILVCWFTVWATSAEQDVLGWYRIPLFSLLFVAAGATFQVGQLFWPTFLVAVTVMNNLGLVRYPTHPLPRTEILRLSVAALLGGGLSYLWWQPKKLGLWLTVAVLMLYSLQGVYTAHAYFAALCRDRDTCPTPYITFSGQIRQLLK